MPAKTKPAPFDIKRNDDGTVTIVFGTTHVELGPILMGQFRTLRAELKECDKRAQDHIREERKALMEIVEWNKSHKDDEGFEPKQFEPNDILSHDIYAEWWKHVVAEIATSGSLPEDSEMWPVGLATPDTIKPIVEHWQFTPLARGGE